MPRSQSVVQVFKELTTGVDNEITQRAITLKSPDQLGRYVSDTPGGITFIAFNSYRKEYGELITINDIHPNHENIVSSKYPLVVTYYIVYDM